MNPPHRPVEPWHIATDRPPKWLGDVSAGDLETLREWAARLTIYKLWFSKESNTLTGDGVIVIPDEDESIVDAFRRLLRTEDERQVAVREADRDREAEAHESLKRFRGKP